MGKNIDDLRTTADWLTIRSSGISGIVHILRNHHLTGYPSVLYVVNINH